MAERERKIEDFIKPMLATSVDKPFSDSEWIFELKLDGYRAVAETGSRKLLLYSRNGLSLTGKYPVVAKALRKIGVEAVLDGEIVLLDEQGKPDFQRLQSYAKNGESGSLVYYVFDILSCKKKDLTQLPLLERKKILKRILKKNPVVRYTTHIETNGNDFFKAVKTENLEGMMAKRKDSLYYPGVRTRDWLKIKNHRSQEAIIIGYTAPKGSRSHFGSLLLAEYRRKKLHYIGHAGTGFTEKALEDLMKKMKRLKAAGPPVDEPIPVNGTVTWIKPQLVCEVNFTEITRQGILRHPVFKGLRPEKKAAAITEESEKMLSVKQVIADPKKTKNDGKT